RSCASLCKGRSKTSKKRFTIHFIFQKSQFNSILKIEASCRNHTFTMLIANNFRLSRVYYEMIERFAMFVSFRFIGINSINRRCNFSSLEQIFKVKKLIYVFGFVLVGLLSSCAKENPFFGDEK